MKRTIVLTAVVLTGAGLLVLLPQWRLKSQEEYIQSLTQNEIRKKGGLEKLSKQPANRYFKRTKLSDIIMLHGQHMPGDEKELLGMFVHFLYGKYGSWCCPFV